MPTTTERTKERADAYAAGMAARAELGAVTVKSHPSPPKDCPDPTAYRVGWMRAHTQIRGMAGRDDGGA